jgi:LPXTG-motif cell wall-anchored protein
MIRQRPVVALAIACFVTAVTSLNVDVASAATYNVTAIACTGPGSFVAAVTAANANPGADTISFAPGLKVDWSSCPPVDSKTGQIFAAIITESVTIEGNGAVLDGNQYWLDTSGIKSPIRKCPSNGKEGVLVVATAPGLFEVGTRGADNSGIAVTVNNLTFREASAVAKLRSGASLTFDHTNIVDIVDIIGNCGRSPLVAMGSNHLTLRDSTLELFVSPGKIDPSSFHFGAISGSGRLDIVRTRFVDNQTNGSFFWSGDVNVVSSQFIDSGGFEHFGGRVRFVNSTHYISKGLIGQADLIVAGPGSTVEFVASTLSSYTYGCGSGCPLGNDSLMFLPSGGTMYFTASAVGNTAERTETGKLFNMTNGGTVSADTYTWMQPTAQQDAAALAALTGQPALLTSPPGLIDDGNELFDYYPVPVGPLLRSGSTPGVLIDAVPDANGANQLRDPITGDPLTTDVFGNPRVDGSGRRNIGAIQAQLAPHLVITKIGNAAASLAWTRPQDPPSSAITGYHLRYRAVGTGTWSGPIVITGPAALTTVVTGLTNGVDYEFEVTAVDGDGEGPTSNIVTGKPFGPITHPPVTATPSPGEVHLTWTPPTDWGGHGASTDYYVNYRIVGQTDFVQLLVSGTETVITGLTSGTQYEFCVYGRALNWSTGGCTPVTATVPAPEVPTTTSPSFPSLPETGRSTRPTMSVAAIALLLGGLAMLVARRRA